MLVFLKSAGTLNFNHDFLHFFDAVVLKKTTEDAGPVVSSSKQLLVRFNSTTC